MNFKLRPTNHTSFYFPEVTSIPATEPSQYLELERQSELAHDLLRPTAHDGRRRHSVNDGCPESASPAVALSENARSEDRTKSIRAAFQNHLAKPVEPSELLAIVGSLAGSEGRNFK